MKTTRKDFERFKTEFVRWQKEFGLTDWRVEFAHEMLSSGAGAEIEAHCEEMRAWVYLGFTITRPVESFARHEALELLLAVLNWLPEQRCVRREEINVARHAAIRRLENYLDTYRSVEKETRP